MSTGYPSSVHERRPHIRAGLLVFAGLVAALASAFLVGSARSASEPSELIAFTRDGAVYAMHPDGSDVRLLWRGSGGPTDLAWSPDGSKLAVSRGRSIWVVNADGTGPVRVARVGASSLTWLPDGQRIAFTSKDDIWLMNADGSSIRLLKRTPEVSEINVDWKPTGGWVAFDKPGWVREVHVMRKNGRNLRNLTPSQTWGLWSLEPDRSPDGRRIALTNCPSTDCDIVVTNASGKQRVQLTTNRAWDNSPIWSPDGRRIAFLRGNQAWPDRSQEIYVMNADGTGVRRLTHNRVAEGSPAWQPVAP